MEKFGVHFDCDIRMRSVYCRPMSRNSRNVCICVSHCVYTFTCLRGYYPKGGGEVMVTVNPVKELQPVTMTERGNITKIHGRAYVAGVLPFKVKLPPQHTLLLLYSRVTDRMGFLGDFI